jgi:RNA polymerase sigma factor (sigma-70 family)
MADIARFYRDAGAERWGVTLETFAAALERSRAKAFAGRSPTASDLDKYYRSLHLSDLALACACGEGIEAAWDHFVSEFRPALYRAADAIDRTGRAREIADALYGELFSRSLFRYFHGRSTLATWLRSLVSQRYVDRLRETKRLEPLADDEREPAFARPGPRTPNGRDDPDRTRFATTMQAVLAAAIAALAPRDRLRLRCYYAEGATLAQIGRVTRESEATVSRQLARTRKAMREEIETRLQREHGFSADETRDCISSMMDDAGSLDLAQLLGERKKTGVDRSKVESLIAQSPRDGGPEDAP